MDYKEYIEKHPHWQRVRQVRLKFDNYQCAFCHCDVSEKFETHHLSYLHLGDERITDVVTLCTKCHSKFHNNWQKQQFWKGREPNHWEAFDLKHTAELCRRYWMLDKFISKDPDGPNLCNQTTQRDYIDIYFKECNVKDHPAIDTNDIGLFVRNKRWELVFDAEARGLTVEQFLDEYYGPKVRGKNPIRQEAGQCSTFNHAIKNMHTHYKENRNIKLLMEVVNNAET